MIPAMAPILTRYGSIFIYSFTVVLALGVLLATLLTAGLARKYFAPDWFDALLIVFAAALLGGRIGFVIGQWTYFQERPAQTWLIWQGGFSYHGALVVGLVALFLWTAAHDGQFYSYAALFSPGLALTVTVGWLACWFDGCAYGRETIMGFWSADLPDEFGVFALRYQTQLIGLLLSLAAFLTILWLFSRVPPATLVWSTLLLLSIAHLVPSIYRGDPIPAAGPLRMDLILDALLIIISSLMLQSAIRRH